MRLAPASRRRIAPHGYPGYTFNIPGTKVIHVDIEPSEIGRNYPTEIGVVADVKATLKILTRVAKEIYPDGFKRPALIRKIAGFREGFRAKAMRKWRPALPIP